LSQDRRYWTPAHKDAGSRQNGWELLREWLKNVRKPEGPRLFVFNTCRQFISTVPVLPRDEMGGEPCFGEDVTLDIDGNGFRDSIDTLVQLPFLTSLFQLNNEFWNHDIVF